MTLDTRLPAGNLEARRRRLRAYRINPKMNGGWSRGSIPSVQNWVSRIQVVKRDGHDLLLKLVTWRPRLEESPEFACAPQPDHSRIQTHPRRVPRKSEFPRRAARGGASLRQRTSRADELLEFSAHGLCPGADSVEVPKIAVAIVLRVVGPVTPKVTWPLAFVADASSAAAFTGGISFSSAERSVAQQSRFPE